MPEIVAKIKLIAKINGNAIDNFVIDNVLTEKYIDITIKQHENMIMGSIRKKIKSCMLVILKLINFLFKIIDATPLKTAFKKANIMVKEIVMLLS